MLKKASEQGLLYEGEKPIWYCPKCETTLAKHEVELGYIDAKYEPAIDPSIYVKFKLRDSENTYLIIWTTTPWTLVYNLGVMVNPDVSYALVEVPRTYVKDLELDSEAKEIKKQELVNEDEKEYWIIAEELVEKLFNKLKVPYKVVSTFPGSELEGKEYIPVFYEELKEELDKIKRECDNAFRVWLTSEYVSTEEGTGLVHSAPGCGPEDYEVGCRYGVKPFNTVDERGVIKNLEAFEGWKAKVDDLKFVELLVKKKTLVYFEWYKHDYPICWRCRTRLIIRLTKQWFLDIQKIKNSLIEDVNNVTFVPEFAKEAFSNVIKFAPDWVITRQRYWGAPLPIWKCPNGHVKVIGSIRELEELTGRKFKTVYIIIKKSEYAEELIKEHLGDVKFVRTSEDKILDDIETAENKTVLVLENLSEEIIRKLEEKYYVVRSFGREDYELIRVYNYDLHRPFVDGIKFKCPECGEEMKRLPDVLDVWIDSGSAPFASRKPAVFPLDFITEGYDQLRGWFYSLAVIGKIFFGEIPYKTVYVHGFVLDEHGRKMSKSLGNVIFPMELINKYGADSVRAYFASVCKAYEEVRLSEKEVKNKLDNLNVLWNTHLYLLEQSRYFNVNPSKESPKELEPIDKYMLHLVEKTKKEVEEYMERYELWKVCRALENLYLELSRFYIKMNRERLQEDPKTVLWVIYKSLLEIINMYSIIAPYITEKIYQNLKEAFGLEKESVHFLEWPKVYEDYINEELEREVDLFKRILESGLALRDRLRISLRWPLKEVYIQTDDEQVKKVIETFRKLIITKLNVKDVKVQNIPRNLESIEELRFKLAYNTEMTEELVKEGLLRELQRRLQNIRKEMGLSKGEKIVFVIEADDFVKGVVAQNLRSLSSVTDSTIFLEPIKIEVQKEKEFEIAGHKIRVSAGFV